MPEVLTLVCGGVEYPPLNTVPTVTPVGDVILADMLDEASINLTQLTRGIFLYLFKPYLYHALQCDDEPSCPRGPCLGLGDGRSRLYLGLCSLQGMDPLSCLVPGSLVCAWSATEVLGRNARDANPTLPLEPSTPGCSRTMQTPQPVYASAGPTMDAG